MPADMPDLLLGPLLRYVGETEATVWVETGAPCEVEVLGHRARTFAVDGHHFALVLVRGLEPGGVHPYEVRLDGEPVWPRHRDPFPAPAIRTLPGEGPVRLAFGSCRVSVPHEPPYTLPKDEDDRGREIDAVHALVQRMRREPSGTWPHAMLFLGDQVYGDEVSPGALEFIRARRDTSQPPGEEVADFEEYSRLYWESWRDPAMRWFLSTVSSSMIWDDHDVHDDWNTSAAWVQEMRAKPWWDRRITAAIASYWVYQHIGNLSPSELAEDELYQRVCAAPDPGAVLREFAERDAHATDGSRWSYYRDFGRTRLVMMDSRGGRVLRPERRCMVDDDEWRWITEHSHGDFDHLLLGTSLPVLLGPGMHHLEAWNEAVCAGAWGGWATGLGERLRQGLDLEHWGAFDDSFDLLVALLQTVATGAFDEDPEPPATVVMLSGDVHHAYVAEVAFRRGSAARSRVYQAVCSPLRNPLDKRERRVIRAGMTRTAHAAGRLLARSAGVQDPAIRWRVCEGPWFDNQIATLDISGRRLDLRIERATPGPGENRGLETVLERSLG